MASMSTWSTTTTASSQVEIRHRPVSWKFPRSELGETLVFYDDHHKEIILINAEFIYKSHKESSKLNKFNIKIPNHTSILKAKFSLQNKYIGLQINVHELEIKSINGDILSIQQCRNTKGGNTILNFHWISTADANLCIVSKNGIELYGFSGITKSMQLLKTIKYETVHSWYLPSQQFVMLINKSFVFYGLQLTHSKLLKLNKFEIVGSADSNNGMNWNNITLISLRNHICAIFIDERKSKLYLFRVIRYQMQLTNSYHLYCSGKYGIFHIDNVLIAYNKTTELPILIDFDGNNYISAPLPITMCYYEGNGSDPIKPKRIFSTSKHMAVPMPQTPPINNKYSYKKPPIDPPPPINDRYKIERKEYEFISPQFICEKWIMTDGEDDQVYFCGNFYRLSLNLDAIVHSWGPEKQIPLLHFLLQRKTSDSKVIIIKMLYEMIRCYCLGYKYDVRSRLDFISEYFIVLNEVLRRAVEESAIIAQNAHQQQVLQKEQEKEKKETEESQSQSQSFTARFRKHSASYAQKLFGSMSPSHQELNGVAASMNRGLPPPHLPSINNANVDHNHGILLPPPPQHTQMNRRVNATLKFDFDKTSSGETVVKTTELLSDIFAPIYHQFLNPYACADEDGPNGASFVLPNGAKWDKLSINSCLNRFCAVLIEYTRTMHRIRLKLPLSISQLLIALLSLPQNEKLYTLHQLFQYHAFPDDEHLAMKLLQIAKMKQYRAGKQLGIDMLLRLQKWSTICHILLVENEIETGTKLFLKKYPNDRKNNEKQIQLSHFLDAAHKSDPIRFYHLYLGIKILCKKEPLNRMFHDEIENFKPRFDALNHRFADKV